MDIFDAISIFGETYTNTKNDMNHNDDYFKVLADNFAKSKMKIDRMYDDEMKKYNKKSELLWELLD